MSGPYLPLALSLIAAVVWPFVFLGLVDFWRHKHRVPSGAIAAFVLAVAGEVIARLLGSLAYLDPWALTDPAILSAHTSRALLATTGLWALAVLVRARLRW